MNSASLFLALGAIAPQDARPIVTDDLREVLTERGTELLEQLHASGDFVGGSAALVLGDGAPIPLVVGLDEPEGRAITAADRFCAGSVGKTYFAACALRLAARGELDLDANVLDLLEDERVAQIPGAEEWTVRMLLRHQTGLARYIDAPKFWADVKADPDRVWAPGDQLAYLEGMQPAHEPGQGWSYSDTGYVVLGMVIEATTGTSVYESIQEHLLDPHGLADTIPQTSRDLPGLVQGHMRMFAAMGMPPRSIDEDGRFCINPTFEYGGGGYVTSPSDLARWGRVLWSGRAFEGEYLEPMLETVPAPMLRARYGLGVMERDSPAGKMLGHDGVFLGYLCAVAYFPEFDLAVAVQGDQDNGRGGGKPMHRGLVDLAAMVQQVQGR